MAHMSIFNARRLRWAVVAGLAAGAHPAASAAPPKQTVNVRQFGAIPDPSCRHDNTAAFRAALAAGAGREVYVPAGTYCLNTARSTLLISAGGTTLFGDGRASLIRWNAPAGTPIAPILDVKAKAVTIHDIAFDHNAKTGGYSDNAYYGNAQPWGDVAVVLEGAPGTPGPDNIKVYNVSAANGFDNCIGVGAIDPKTNLAVRGRPQGVTLDRIRTSGCGVGIHGGGAHGGNPGRIGFGIDNGAGVDVTISNSIDVGSFDGFADDLGAGAQTTFRNITSYSAQVDKAHPDNGSGLGLYIGSPQNVIENLSIQDAGSDGMWLDYRAWPVTMTNVSVKNSAGNCLHLKSGATISGLACENTGGASAYGKFHEVWIDASGGPMPGPVNIKGLSPRGQQRATVVTVTGKYPVAGDIEAQALPGAGPVDIPPPSRGTLKVHKGA